MIASTALLIRERGARATSIDAVLEHSGAPRGSVYHHFPGGREQLLREATDYAGEYVAQRLEQTAADDPLAALDSLLDEYRATLVATDFRAAAPSWPSPSSLRKRDRTCATTSSASSTAGARRSLRA